MLTVNPNTISGKIEEIVDGEGFKELKVTHLHNMSIGDIYRISVKGDNSHTGDIGFVKSGRHFSEWVCVDDLTERDYPDKIEGYHDLMEKIAEDLEVPHGILYINRGGLYGTIKDILVKNELILGCEDDIFTPTPETGLKLRLHRYEHPTGSDDFGLYISDGSMPGYPIGQIRPNWNYTQLTVVEISLPECRLEEGGGIFYAYKAVVHAEEMQKTDSVIKL